MKKTGFGIFSGLKAKRMGGDKTLGGAYGRKQAEEQAKLLMGFADYFLKERINH